MKEFEVFVSIACFLFSYFDSMENRVILIKVVLFSLAIKFQFCTE